MNDKMFLIMKEDESDAILEQKVLEFVKNTFDESILDKISIEVDNYAYEETPWIEYKCIEIKFNEFKYYNQIHGECVESVGMVLEDKGLQPFYADGQFISLNVLEWVQGVLIQKIDTIYGITKDKIYTGFTDYILTC